MKFRELADDLYAAWEKGEKVPAAPTAHEPGFDLAAAYEVEKELSRRRLAAGAKVAGRKVGYANKAVWRIMKLETLVWARMYSDTIRNASSGHSELSLAGLRSTKLEPEIVFGLRHSPDPNNTDAVTTLSAVEWLAIGFEIIDCPYPEWQFQPADFIASFGLHAALIVGEKVPVSAENISELADQLAKFKVKVFKGDEFIEEGAGKNSLRNPALCLAELARATAAAGDPLRPGELISSGTLTTGHLLAPDETWRVEIEGLPLQNLSVKTK